MVAFDLTGSRDLDSLGLLPAVLADADPRKPVVALELWWALQRARLHRDR